MAALPDRPLLGVSTCLMGESVRYDGGHKLDRYLRDVLGSFVEFVPVCPEVECGMPVPRPSLRLVEIGVDGEVGLLRRNDGEDLTEMMVSWARRRLEELAALPLCGYVFKAKSPSSGLYRVRVYDTEGNVKRRDASGIFAGMFVRRFPLLPVEDEGRLHDAGIRDNFITRVFVMYRWRELLSEGMTIRGLIAFHTAHKYLLMAHDPEGLRTLGRMVAEGASRPEEELYSDYFARLMETLSRRATVRKNTNVLQHLMGYFKEDLTADEKQELLELIESYHGGLVPLVVPVTLLGHYVRKFRPANLLGQVYLEPHPMELMLRNHV